MPKIIAKKKDWIKLGYQLFSDQGEYGIVIEKMAKKMTCNKSSFYWHFKTKKAFIDEIIAYWVMMETKEIIKLIEKETSASQKFKVLIMLSFKKNKYLDFVFHLKKYAIKDKKIKDAIYTIDCRRRSVVQSLLIKLGYSEEGAKIKTSILYKFMIGYHETIRYRKQSKNYVEEVMREIEHFINIGAVSKVASCNKKDKI